MFINIKKLPVNKSFFIPSSLSNLPLLTRCMFDDAFPPNDPYHYDIIKDKGKEPLSLTYPKKIQMDELTSRQTNIILIIIAISIIFVGVISIIKILNDLFPKSDSPEAESSTTGEITNEMSSYTICSVFIDSSFQYFMTIITDFFHFLY